MTSLFDVGKSALNSYRQSLAVTGQNIANIDTEGYKRRGASLEEVSANQSGVNSIGNSPGLGVRVSEIRRAFDETPPRAFAERELDLGPNFTETKRRNDEEGPASPPFT